MLNWRHAVAAELSILVFRVALMAGLYLFLLAVVLVVSRDIRQVGETAAEPAPRGRLVVIGAYPEVVLDVAGFDLRASTAIGRDQTNDIELPDSFVSAEHAVVSHHDGRWWIEDLGSTNGTRLNNRVVSSKAQPMAYNDVIQIGRVRLKLSRA